MGLHGGGQAGRSGESSAAAGRHACALPSSRRASRAQKGIKKLKRLLEGEAEEQFNAEQYMHLYT